MAYAMRRRSRRALGLLAAIGLAGCRGDAPPPDQAVQEKPTAGLEIALPPPTSSERGDLSSNEKGTPYQIGFGRHLRGGLDKLALRDLRWSQWPNGSVSTTITIRSATAKSLRVAVNLEPPQSGLRIGFVPGRSGQARLPQSFMDSAAMTAGLNWSPVIDGDTVTIVLLATEVPAKGVVLSIPVLSHIP
jgi:hypothetical protein